MSQIVPIAQSLKYAWRSLRRSPGFTTTAALTLTIGIAATTAIFAVVNGVLLKPLPFGNPDRLVAAWHELPPLNLKKAEQTSATYYTYKRLAHTIESIGLFQTGAANVSEPGGATEPQRVSVTWMTASLLPTLQVSPQRGRNFTEAEDIPDGPNVVIISDGMWHARFAGDPQIVGRKLEVNGLTREIIGVMPASFRYPDAKTQIWIPLGLEANPKFSGGFNYDCVARLKPGVTVADAQRDFAAVLTRIAEISPMLAPGVPMSMLLEQAKPVPVLIPLRADMTGDIARTLWMVAAAAGLVLLVACFNVANLILVRADGRQRELAVREALGAGRARVLAHFLAESGVVTAVATAAGVFVAWMAVRSLVAAGPEDIPRLAEVGLDATTIGFALLVGIAVTFICSVVPAMRIGRAELSKAIREGGRSGTAGKTQHRVRGALVSAQVALALVVLAASGLLVRTFQRLNQVRPGFDAERVATMWIALPQARYKTDSGYAQFYARLLERMNQMPGVSAAGVTSRLPLEQHGTNQSPFYAEGDESNAKKIPHLQLYTTVDGGYFKAMGIPLLAGKTFERLDVQRADEAIVNSATAWQFFKDSTGRSVVGKRFKTLPEGPWITIIGVVGATRDTSLAADVNQVAYFPEVAGGKGDFDSQTARTMALVLKTNGDPATYTNAVQRMVHDLDASLPLFDVRPMQRVMRDSMAQLSFIIIILGAAAIVTMLLGAIGLYGVMAYLVTLRTKELGVRIALGAQPAQVAAMMTRQGITLSAIGIVGGLALFALVARFLRSFLFGVAPADPVALAGASIALAVIAALASWIPARRASRVDPADALRSE